MSDQFSLLAALSFFISTFAYGSAIVQKDDQRQLITVRSEIIFYGPQASEEVAQASSTEIQTYWNGGSNDANASQYLAAIVDGKKYQVVFEISHLVVSEADAKKMLAAHPGPERNFIKILQGVPANGDRSYMDGLGANEGLWYLSDNLGHSTTTAHEFGHGLGIDHPNESDFRGRGQPAIMCPRGTVVDAIYQYYPTANPDIGEPGSTINPYKRKVIQWDINNLQFSKLSYDSQGKSALNKGLELTPFSNDPRILPSIHSKHPHQGRIY